MNDIIESPFGTRKEVADTATARQLQSREARELEVQYIMARRFPRDPVKSRDLILNAFSRTRLAEAAQYEYSKGGTDIRGPSIKAMEEIATRWGTVHFGWRIMSRGVEPTGVPYSEIEAFAIDLESLAKRSLQFPVPHWRDRSERKGGGYVLTDEREIYELCANMAQRRVRSCLQAVIPSDVVEDAMDQADLTLKQKADTSPEAMTKMVEAFAQFGVGKEPIERLIQRHLDSISPAQVVRLKRIYASLRDGMSEPAEWFDMGGGEAAAAEGGEGTPPPAGNAGGGASRTDAVKSRLKGGAKKTAPAAAGAKAKAAPAMKYAEVADALNAATTHDALDVAADLIKHVADEGQRNELEQLYSARAGELDEGTS